MKISLIYMIFGYTLLISCSDNSKKQQEIGKASYTYNLEKIETKVEHSAKVKDLEYISLETNEKSIFGFPSKIIYRSNKFYILDKRSKGIFIFDKNGKFNSKIRKPGKGPGEYTELADFDIDNNGNIYVWDVSIHKLIKYSSTGETLNEYYFRNYVFLNFSIISTNKLLLHTIFSDGKLKSSVGVYNIKTSEFEEILAANEKYEDYTIVRPSFSSLYPLYPSVYFSILFRPELYKIDSMQVSKFISFNTELIPPIEYLDDFKGNGNCKSSKNYFRNINSIYEIGDNLVFKLGHLYESYIMVVNKKNGNYKISKCIFDDRLFGYGLIRGTAEDKFISVLESEFFLKKDWKDIVKKNPLSSENKKIIYSANENSNPILMLYKFEESSLPQ